MSEGESFAQRLQLRIALPHDLVSRVRIVGAANVSTESGYKAHGITESSGLCDSFFCVSLQHLDLRV